MKLLFSILTILFAFAAHAQRIKVENRDGKAVIVRTEINAAGETKELAEWRADPIKVLQDELSTINKQLVASYAQIQRLQEAAKGRETIKAEIEKAISDLEKGLQLETGIPDETTPAPKAAPKKKTTKKAKKQ
jgi:hypothetical protein